ncbi:MAG: sensor histidine kinase [Candidatus Omnitrophica bacterium]|nr:sensor histidine kinase [Candidatus Omnitrophota bacterium]
MYYFKGKIHILAAVTLALLISQLMPQQKCFAQQLKSIPDFSVRQFLSPALNMDAPKLKEFFSGSLGGSPNTRLQKERTLLFFEKLSPEMKKLEQSLLFFMRQEQPFKQNEIAKELTALNSLLFDVVKKMRSNHQQMFPEYKGVLFLKSSEQTLWFANDHFPNTITNVLMKMNPLLKSPADISALEIHELKKRIEKVFDIYNRHLEASSFPEAFSAILISKYEGAVQSRRLTVLTARMFAHGVMGDWNIAAAFHPFTTRVSRVLKELARKDKENPLFISTREVYYKLLDWVKEQNRFFEEIKANATTWNDEKFLDIAEEFTGKAAEFSELIIIIEDLCKQIDSQFPEHKTLQAGVRDIEMFLKQNNLVSIMRFFLERFSQGRLRNDENVEVISLLRSLNESALANHHRNLQVPVLHISTGQEKYWVYGIDRAALSGLFSRFVSNGLHLGIKNIYVTITNTWQGANIIIEDDGKGIDEDLLLTSNGRQKIFAAGESKRKGGTGCGLAFAYEISRLLGGYILADKSETYSGAKFTIVIPSNPQQSAQSRGSVPLDTFPRTQNYEHLIKSAI